MQISDTSYLLSLYMRKSGHESDSSVTYLTMSYFHNTPIPTAIYLLK
jgi:hypothetical protein